MNYVINISQHGKFYFEIARLSDKANSNINEFAGKLRDDYPVKDGFKVEVKIKTTTIRLTEV